jgi:hypothetical protein
MSTETCSPINKPRPEASLARPKPAKGPKRAHPSVTGPSAPAPSETIELPGGTKR